MFKSGQLLIWWNRRDEGRAMDLADLIEPDQVVYAARASNKQQLLQDLASRAATLLNPDAQTIVTALQAREELGSTGLGYRLREPDQ